MPVKRKQLMPLEYMLKVMRDPSVDVERRDRMAVVAAPYCHAKLSERKMVGQKERQAESARQAGVGTPWAADLEFDGRAS